VTLVGRGVGGVRITGMGLDLPQHEPRQRQNYLADIGISYIIRCYCFVQTALCTRFHITCRSSSLQRSFFARSTAFQFATNMASNELIKLSNIIAKKTKVLSDYLESKGSGFPSFNIDGLAEYPISPEEVIPFEARLELIAASKELYALAHGPKDHIRNLCWDVSLDEMHQSFLLTACRRLTRCPYRPCGPLRLPRLFHLPEKSHTRR
jgi:hypothetical protein